MPVNTAALKTFAPAMRRQLLEAVGRKLDLLLNSQTPDTLSTYAKQISELRNQEAENREQLLERVAYTWFNRLCALRYLDARGWHPFGCKVLMPAAEGETQPELLKLMRAGSLPAELKSHTNESRLHGLLDGQIPPAMAGSDPQGEVYRELILASCRSYHQLLPELFEGLDDASELLLPDDLLSEGSIAGGFRSTISDADCEDVEIIGWLYQFYISEKKDQVIGKVVKSEDIPAATQLFTPNWIAKYMVQNSLGATWLATYPDSPLKGQMEFYIEPAKQTAEVQAQLEAITPKSLVPEALTLIDPACGSGHILVEAYSLLRSIYIENGYQNSEIPRLILSKNLYGLDICPRAVQLATFSLLMKGREDNRRFLESPVQINLISIDSPDDLEADNLISTSRSLGLAIDNFTLRQVSESQSCAKDLGSITKLPLVDEQKLDALHILAKKTSDDIIFNRQLLLLGKLLEQFSALRRKYDIVVTNPPYLGSRGMNKSIKDYAKSNYKVSKSDLYSIFVQRWLSSVKPGGVCAFVTPYTWMTISSQEAFREMLFEEGSVTTLIQPSYTSFFDSAIVPLVTFTVRAGLINSLGRYVSLGYLGSGSEQPNRLRESLKGSQKYPFYTCSLDDFRIIPGAPLAYAASKGIRDAFKSPVKLEGLVDFTASQNKTGDNARYVRYWWEVPASRISSCKWIPYAKGGGKRKWWGFLNSVVDWSDAAKRFYSSNATSNLLSDSYCFRKGITYSMLTSGQSTFRVLPAIGAYDMGGPAFHPDNEETSLFLLAICNSSFAAKILDMLNPTLNLQARDVKNIPIPIVDKSQKEKLAELASLCVMTARNDWESFEENSGFSASPIIAQKYCQAKGLSDSFRGLREHSIHEIERIKEAEEDINKLLVAAFDIASDVQVDVENEQVGLLVNPAYRYGGETDDVQKWSRFKSDSVTEFISFGLGCMMGRYSLDHPGLILAESRENQAEQLAAYEEKVGKPLSEVRFKPDPDGIIPVLDGEWFEDDIVARTREFLTVTFPESTVTENLRFIEESLGKDIRKYFCTEFYKDHLQTYKKRPIYWLVQSPKKGFSCLIYLHRYTKDTLNQVLNNYFRPYLQKLEARLAQLDLDQLNDDLPTRERTAARKEAEKIAKVLKECQAWEQDALLPLAQQRIELDLDDGVKVNYLNLQDVLAPIPGLAAKED